MVLRGSYLAQSKDQRKQFQSGLRGNSINSPVLLPSWSYWRASNNKKLSYLHFLIYKMVTQCLLSAARLGHDEAMELFPGLCYPPFYPCLLLSP